MKKEREKKEKKKSRKEQGKKSERALIQAPKKQGGEIHPSPQFFWQGKVFKPLSLFLLILIATISYSNSFNVPFQFDDRISIVENSYIRLKSLSPSSLFKSAFQNFKQNRPLSNLSFALNYYFHELNPFGYHTVNFFFHILTGICLFLILSRIFSRNALLAPYSNLIGFLSSALWIVSPINTQAVTYIVQRHTSMAGAFCLLAILFYDLGRSKGRRIYYVIGAISGFCGMLCKETALLLPVFIFLYEIYFFQELKEGWMRRSFYGVIAICAFYALAFIILFSGRSLSDFGSKYEDFAFSTGERILSQGRILIWYMSLIIFPAGSRLSIDHNFPVSKSLIEPIMTMPAYFLVLCLILFGFIYARRYRFLSFGIFWYFGQLSLESLPLPIDLTFEHRLYLAGIPFFVVIAMSVYYIRRKWLSVFIICLLVFFNGALAYRRNDVWRSPLSLWKDAVLKAPFHMRSEYNLGNEYYVKENKNQAILCYQRAIKGKYSEWRAHFNLALTLYDLGRFDEAISEYQIALRFNPKDPEKVRNNLGYAFQKKGDLENAIKEYKESLKINPRFHLAQKNLGKAYLEMGRCDEAWEIHSMMGNNVPANFTESLNKKCPR